MQNTPTGIFIYAPKWNNAPKMLFYPRNIFHNHFNANRIQNGYKFIKGNIFHRSFPPVVRFLFFKTPHRLNALHRPR